jgi:ribosome biogenesis GTPase
VGKSSLINAVDPTLDLRTKEISKAYQLGQHTTTFAELFPLQFGGQIIDTPGIKSFGLIDIEREELGHFFPEIFSLAASCKFHNCLHLAEPGCAVRKAYEEQKLAPTRYENYLKILEGDEDESVYR